MERKVKVFTLVSEFVANLIANSLTAQPYCNEMYLEVVHNDFGTWDVVATHRGTSSYNIAMAMAHAAGVVSGYMAAKN